MDVACWRDSEGILSSMMLAACGGGGSSSPSSPTTSYPYYIYITLFLTSTASEDAIQEARLALDGTVITTECTSIQNRGCGFTVREVGVEAGHHTLTVTIIRPSPLSQNITVDGAINVYDSEARYIKNIDLEMKTMNASTGQSVTYPFEI